MSGYADGRSRVIRWRRARRGQNVPMQAFKITTTDEVLADLRERLSRTRFRNDLPGEDWGWGTPQPWLRRLVEHWLYRCDWRRTEAELNALPQVVGDFAGLRVHAFVVRSRHEDATPLLLCHGWPGSVVEFQDCLPALVDPTSHGGRAEDAFHVVLPSMPGFGLSGPTAAPGVDVAAIADAFAALMYELGHPHFLAQGGDRGPSSSGSLALSIPIDSWVCTSTFRGRLPRPALMILWPG